MQACITGMGIGGWSGVFAESVSTKRAIRARPAGGRSTGRGAVRGCAGVGHDAALGRTLGQLRHRPRPFRPRRHGRRHAHRAEPAGRQHPHRDQLRGQGPRRHRAACRYHARLHQRRRDPPGPGGRRAGARAATSGRHPARRHGGDGRSLPRARRALHAAGLQRQERAGRRLRRTYRRGPDPAGPGRRTGNAAARHHRGRDACRRPVQPGHGGAVRGRRQADDDHPQQHARGLPALPQRDGRAGARRRRHRGA